LVLLIQEKVMVAKPTVQSVSSQLNSHEAKCEERWKSIFKETAEIKQEMNDLNGTLKMALFGSFGFMATLLTAFILGVFNG
jgi:hypothetical protein